MSQVQEQHNSTHQSQKDNNIVVSITEQGLTVRVTSNGKEHQTNVYEGVVDTKELADGSSIAENFTSLE